MIFVEFDSHNDKHVNEVTCDIVCSHDNMISHTVYRKHGSCVWQYGTYLLSTWIINTYFFIQSNNHKIYHLWFRIRITTSDKDRKPH